MWNREEVKSKAWNYLKSGKYLYYFIITLILGIVGTNLPPDIIEKVASFFSLDADSIGMSIFMIATQIFVVGPLDVSVTRIFRDKLENLDELKYGFEKNYKRNVKIQFYKNLEIALWSLALIIPGIIKYYEYKFVEFLISDYPNLNKEEIFEKSKEMTNGQKKEIFYLDLSFIGWYILGSLFFKLGQYFVFPYHKMTIANLYNKEIFEDKKMKLNN